jgi:hypothetical protein
MIVMIHCGFAKINEKAKATSVKLH